MLYLWSMERILNLIGQATGTGRFVSFMYLDSKGDLSRYTLQPGISYPRLKQKSLLALAMRLMVATDALVVHAITEIIQGLRNGKRQPYVATGMAGVVKHEKTGELYVYGRLINKRIMEYGSAPKSGPVNHRSELTRIKAELRAELPIGDWRCFKLSRISGVRAENQGAKDIGLNS